MRATPDQVRKVMQQYVQAWATGNRELFMSLFAADARWADPVGSPSTPFRSPKRASKFLFSRRMKKM